VSLRSLSFVQTWFVICWVMLLVASPGRALRAEGAGQGRAALVISYSPGRYVVRTLDVPAAGVSGLDALRTLGIYVSEKSGLICSIGAEGCRYPGEDCFCALPNYWGYWRLGEQGWRFSPVGAGGSTLAPGQVDGWAWGTGGAPPTVSAVALWDVARVAPDVPVIEGVGTLSLRAPFTGDANGNAQATSTLTCAAWTAHLEMIRVEGAFTGTLPPTSWPGRYIVATTITDPDGVNGSASWESELLIEGSYQAFLAAVSK
jgi:hypothetical protein